MAAPNPQKPPAWNVIRIIWFALLASTFIYLVVMFVATPPRDAPPDQTMAMALAMVALTTAAISVLMPRMMFKKSISMMKLPTRELVDPNASPILRDEAPKLRVYEDLNAARRAVTGRFFTPFILGMALSEAVAIYGLVLGFLGHPPSISLPFFVIAWILMLPRFPREDAVMRQVEEITGVRFLEPTG